MARIIGVEISDKKPVKIALTRIYGVGRVNVVQVLAKAKISPEKRVEQLKAEEIARITKVLEEFKTEGDLRQEVVENIKRLKSIGSYRGSRHLRNLPARGQRTRTNARTKRGRRATVGALKRKDTVIREPVEETKTETKSEEKGES